MYVPELFAVDDPAEVADLLAQMRLGVLVTHGPSGLYASHIPLIHDAGRNILIGHLARTNPQPQLADPQAEALAIIELGEAYVSPSYYPADYANRVPTWNYQAVHVYGRLSWHGDEAWLRENLARLTARFEAGRTHPWRIEDSPKAYMDGMVRGTMGFELAITRIEAKRKLSQNRGPAERAAVRAALAESDRQEDRAVAFAMDRLAGAPPRAMGEADADSPSALPVYPPAQGDGS